VCNCFRSQCTCAYMSAPQDAAVSEKRLTFVGLSFVVCCTWIMWYSYNTTKSCMNDVKYPQIRLQLHLYFVCFGLIVTVWTVFGTVWLFVLGGSCSQMCVTVWQLLTDTNSDHRLQLTCRPKRDSLQRRRGACLGCLCLQFVNVIAETQWSQSLCLIPSDYLIKAIERLARMEKLVFDQWLIHGQGLVVSDSHLVVFDLYCVVWRHGTCYSED
jgi:hypothetical protein